MGNDNAELMRSSKSAASQSRQHAPEPSRAKLGNLGNGKTASMEWKTPESRHARHRGHGTSDIGSSNKLRGKACQFESEEQALSAKQAEEELRKEIDKENERSLAIVQKSLFGEEEV